MSAPRLARTMSAPRWALRAIESLLDPAILEEFEPDSLRWTFQRQKAEGTIAGFEVQLRRGHGLLGTRRMFCLRRAPGERLLEEDTRFERHALLSSQWCDPLPAYRTNAEEGVSLRCFPVDRRMPALAWQLEARALTRLLENDSDSHAWRLRKRPSRIEIRSYRPERRVVAAWSTSEIDERNDLRRQRHLILRLHAQALPSRRELYAALDQVGIAAPRWIADGSRGEQLESLVSGTPLEISDSLPTDDLAQVGRMIGTLHQRVPGRVLANKHTHRDALDAARQAIENLRPIDPVRSGLATQALGHIESSPPPPSTEALLHGDLHCGQLLRTREGFALVDWDRAAIGDPAVDVGNLVAHLQIFGTPLSDCLALLHGYRDHAPCDLEQIECQRQLQALRLLDLDLRRPGTGGNDWTERVLRILREGRLT